MLFLLIAHMRPVLISILLTQDMLVFTALEFLDTIKESFAALAEVGLGKFMALHVG